MMDRQTREAIGRLAEEIARIDRRTRTQGRAHRVPQLAHSSLEEGQSLEVRGPGGVRQRIGWLPDGTVGMVTEGGDPVSAPSAPTVVPSLGGLRVTWDGTLDNEVALPGDFDHMAVHVSTSSGFEPSAATYFGTIRRAGEGGMLPVIPLPYVEHYVRLVPVTTGGIQGTPSAEVSGTPVQSGAADLEADSVAAVHVQAGAIEADALEAVLALVTTIVAGIPGAARVELDQDGLRGYNTANELIFAIDSAGNAVFSGDIVSSHISGGSIDIGDSSSVHIGSDSPTESVIVMESSSGANIELHAHETGTEYFQRSASGDPSLWVNASDDGVQSWWSAPTGGNIVVDASYETAQIRVGSPVSSEGNGNALYAVIYGMRKSVGDLATMSIQGPYQQSGVGADRLAMIDLESANANRDATQATYFAAQHVFAGGITGSEVETSDGVVSIGATHTLLAPRHAPLRTDMLANPNFAITGDFAAMSSGVMPALVFTTGWSGRVRIDITAAGYNNNSAASSLALGFNLAGGSAVAADLKRCWYAGGHDNPDCNTRTLHMDLAALSEYTLTPHYRISSGGPATAAFDLAFEQSIVVTPLW